MLTRLIPVWIAALIFGAAIGGPIYLVGSQFHPPLPTQKQEGVQTGESPANAECCQTPHPESFGERLANDPVAFFTMLLATITGGLAVYTGLLWRSTSKLVAGADKTAERQLRAYVHPDSTNLWDGSTLTPPQPHRTNIPGIFVQWRNTGETPAKNVVSWARVAVFSPQYEARFKPPPKLEARFSNNLGRGVPGNKSLWYRRALTQQQAADVGTGRLGIYIYGRIEYEDIFKKKRWTTFKFVYTNSIFPPIAGGGGSFNICQSGNETDDD